MASLNLSIIILLTVFFWTSLYNVRIPACTLPMAAHHVADNPSGLASLLNNLCSKSVPVFVLALIVSAGNSGVHFVDVRCKLLKISMTGCLAITAYSFQSILIYSIECPLDREIGWVPGLQRRSPPSLFIVNISCIVYCLRERVMYVITSSINKNIPTEVIDLEKHLVYQSKNLQTLLIPEDESNKK